MLMEAVSADYRSAIRETSIFAEKTRLLYRQSPVGIPASFFNGLILSYVLWGVVDHAIIAIWFGSLFSVSAIRLFRTYQFLEKEREITEAYGWAREYIFMHFITGIIWGMAGVFLLPENSLMHQSIVALILGGMVAGGVGVYSVMLESTYAFCLPTLIPLIVNCLRYGDEIHLTISVTATVFLVIMINSARQINSHVVKSLELTESLKDEISVRKQTEANLLEAKESAENATRLKDQFVTLVSHDLRSPLSSILAALNLVIANNKSALDAPSIGRLDKCASSLTGLLAMIGKLLDINRLRTGRIRTFKKFHNTRSLIEPVVERLSSNAKEKGIHLALDIPGSSRVFVDGDLFGEVIQNLVGNAVKFCDKGNAVTVSVSTADQNTIAVKDDGPGVAPELLPKLFTDEPLPKSLGTRGEKGGGLGLSLCQNIMKAHDGEIAVDSASGKGAEFRLRLPKSEAVVLIVDDQEAFRLQVIEHLKGMEVGIVEAENGREALLKLMEVTPQVIITDIGMPVMDGLRLLTELRKSSVYSQTPVIVATSDDNLEMRDKAFKCGATDFVVKPLAPNDFVPRVRRFVG